MSRSVGTSGEGADTFDVEWLVDLLERIGESVTAMKRAIVGDEDDDLVEFADDLWELLDELEDLLSTIDMAEIPDAIDFDDLPETVDLEDVPEGLVDEDETAIELSEVRQAVHMRELWDAVDLTQLVAEKREFDDAAEDVAENFDDELVEDSDDDDVVDDENDEFFENVVGTGSGAHVQFDAQARQAYLEEVIQDAVEEFRSELLLTHEKLRSLYEANQAKLGQPGRQPDSLNPTAIATMPQGPVPASVSTRTSTVPAGVKYSTVENPRRIYGRRFTEATDAGTSSDEPDDETTSDPTETRAEVDQ